MSTTTRIDLKDFSRELDKFSKATVVQQQHAVANAFAKAIPRLVKASPVDQGLYAQSWDFSIDEKQAILGNYAPYAAIIEHGARPHTPPIAPLLEWAKRVLKDPSQPPEYSPRVWRLARGVQHKIAEHGQKPLHILENDLPNIFRDIQEELNRLG